MPIVTVKRCHVIQREGKAKAFLSLELSGKVVIHGCRLVEGLNGLFLSMPQEKSLKDNKWYDQVQILDRDLKGLMSAVAIEHYEKLRDGNVAASVSPSQSADPF